MKKFNYLLLTLLTVLTISCFGGSNSDSNNTEKPKVNSFIKDPEYMKLLAGTWELKNNKYKGTEQEFYTFNLDGSMSYYIREKQRTVNDLTKFGNWQAKKDTLKVNVEGNSGDVKITYILSNGVWLENTNSNNYLLKQ